MDLIEWDSKNVRDLFSNLWKFIWYKIKWDAGKCRHASCAHLYVSNMSLTHVGRAIGMHVIDMPPVPSFWCSTCHRPLLKNFKGRHKI